MGIWESVFDKYCEKCKRVTNWKAWNDGCESEQFCEECAEI